MSFHEIRDKHVMFTHNFVSADRRGRYKAQISPDAKRIQRLEA